MPYAVNPDIRDIEIRKQMQEYVAQCPLATPEDVAKCFTYYTYLIWDYQLFGEIYRFYTDDVVMHYEAGISVQGLQSVIAGTLASKHGMTFQYRHLFADIFAEGDPENGYHFIQSTSYLFTDMAQWREDPMQDNQILPQGVGNCMCECELRRIDGKWQITSEWMC